MDEGYRRLIKAIGGLWFAAALMMALMLAMGAATVFETGRGAELAGAEFYLSWWFKVLLALFALNVLAAVLLRLPFRKAHIPFICAHVGILLVLAGALCTDLYGINGRLALANGETSDRYVTTDDTLMMQKAGDTGKTELNIEKYVGGRFSEVNLSDAGQLDMDEVTVTPVRYWPDFKLRRLAKNDNLTPNAAFQVVAEPESQANKPTWIFAGTRQMIANIPVAVKQVLEATEWQDLLKTSNVPTGPRVLVRVGDQQQAFPLKLCQEQSVAADGGVEVRVLRYLPHAVVSKERKIVNASENPVNPAVEVELRKGEVVYRRIAFAKFPEFSSKTTPPELANVKVIFKSGGGRAAHAPVEFYAGPEGQTAVRLRKPDDSSEVVEISVGKTLEIPGSGQSIKVLNFFDNARETQEPTLPETISKNRQPAVELVIATPNSKETVWLKKNTSKRIDLASSTYELAYQDRDLPLGFKVRLKEFQVGYYPGGMRPRTFESSVTFENPQTNDQRATVISMNHPGKYGGFTFYQSSYSNAQGRTVSILSVAKDPGLPIVYFGYFLIVGGMLWVLLRKMMSGRKNPMASKAEGKTTQRGAALLAVLLASISYSTMAGNATPDALDKFPVDSLNYLRQITVQSEGRYMPLDTLARMTVNSITGKEKFDGIDPLVLLMECTVRPAFADKKPLIVISNTELRKFLELPAGRTRYSFNELINHAPFLKLMENAERKPADVKKDALDLKVLALRDRMLVLQEVLNGKTITLVPDLKGSSGAWDATRWLVEHGDDTYPKLRAAWMDVASSFIAREPGQLLKASQDLLNAQRALPVKYGPTRERIAMELHYNQLKPYTIAWATLLVGALLALISVFCRKKAFEYGTTLVVIIGFAVLTYGIYLRWSIAGRIPASNMFESLLFLSWGAAIFTILGPFLLKNRVVTLTGASIAGISLMLADVLPITPYIKPVAPVLLDTFWMAVHVPVIMISYAILAISVLVAHVQILGMGFGGKRWRFEKETDTFLYWYMASGALLLIVGILTGSMWAASSWGRYWGWDPKEVWSLVAFLGYMAIIHIRVNRDAPPLALKVFAGATIVAVFSIVVTKLSPVTIPKVAAYLGIAGAMCYFVMANSRFATAAKSILAFWLIIMTYVGVNYILGTGLHSYGFGTSAAARGMIMTGSADLILLAVCSAAFYLRHKNEVNEAGQNMEFPEP